MIAILLDLIVVLVFVVSVYFGYKRGLLASIFHLLGSLISMVLAILLSLIHI